MTRVNLFTGKWLIPEMSEWDADYFNEEVRARYIEISRALDTTRPGPERSRLVEELDELER